MDEPRRALISGITGPSRTTEELGWQPRCGFAELVAEMVAEDWRAAGIDVMLRCESGGPGYG